MKKERIRHTPARARKVEAKYGQQLRMIAGYVDSLVKGFDVQNTEVYPSIQSALRHYAAQLDVWATNAAGRILTDIALRDEQTWLIYAQDISRGLRDEIRGADTGHVMRGLMQQQVELIKSIPLDAAQRIHDLSIEALINGDRADSLVEEILKSGEVAESRARTIARTEVSRATTLFTQARAEAIGSEGYIWRTSEDGDVRPSHKKMDGKFVPWSTPPTLVEVTKTGKTYSMTGHAGCHPNCRCYPEPVIPE